VSQKDVGAQVLEIVVHKATRTLILVTAGGSKRSYPVVLGKNSSVDKMVEGDHATPVGNFFICAKNPRSKYFLSLCLSYPNEEDAERGLAAKIIGETEHAQIIAAIRERKMPPQHTALGGEIYIHGHALNGGNLLERDWTRGCIAVDNAAMQVIYDLAVIGTPVRILP
jgi:murein L,D-transpeptidase YafK